MRMIASEGLVPNGVAASLLNAYVNTGTMDGAEALMERMRGWLRAKRRRLHHHVEGIHARRRRRRGVAFD